MLDMKIVTGAVIDGTGRPRFEGDIGIKNGRIVAIGKVDEDARETIDAKGRVVAPGFIDVHTHYDAQAFWEPTFSPSCYHGVTTIVGGFCGFSIAPITPEAAGYVQRMLSRVEGMPLATLEAAVPWNWSSFGDYLSLLEGKIGLNAGFFAGHSTIRRVVMGERAVGEKATATDMERMKTLLDAALAEGALGFSTTVSATHNDYEGKPVPSRWADHDEFMELARIVSKHEGTGLEMLPDVDFAPGVAELLSDFSVAGNRPVNWNVLRVSTRPGAAEAIDRQLNVSNIARERGGEVLALTAPSTPGAYLSPRTGFVFDALPGMWREVFKAPLERRVALMKDPAVRKKLAEDAATVRPGASLEPPSRIAELTVVSVQAERNKKYVGKKIREIVAEEGGEPIDVMFDIALADDLGTIFSPDFGGYDHATFELRAKIWADDRTIIGGSDAGAHLDLIDGFAFSTDLLEQGVRQHKVIGLEQAVHKITQRPAAYFGLIDRGLIAEGYLADLVVFDPETVGRSRTYQRFDVPGGKDFRLYADAVGVDHVIVNGVQIVRNGEHTGAMPGKVLRSGKDTRTVPLDALRDTRAAAE